MEKWVLRLVLAVLTVVTCCFVFRNTETKDRSLLYQKCRQWLKTIWVWKVCSQKSIRFWIMRKIREKDAFSWWLYIETTHQE